MPPILALFLTLALIVFLFRRDFREKPNITSALWVPFLWTFLISSRTVSQWLNIFGLPGFGGAPSSLEEGSPLDASVYFTLIFAGVCILAKRRVRLSELLRDNGWLMAFLLYCFIAIQWSDYPFVSFKRWIKILGHPVIALVLFTEPDFEEALRRLMKRSAYVLIPVSILFIKYFPHLGREAGGWDTQSANCGIARGKNALGSICLFLGFFFFWHLLRIWRAEKGKARREELLLGGSFLIMIWWLLRISDSATALLSLLISSLLVVLLGLKGLNKRLIGTYAVTGVMVLVVAQFAFGFLGTIVDLTGHSDTLEGRGVLWRDLLAFKTNPLLGSGFESFWTGDRLVKLHEGRSWQPNEAHNGYLEVYLNLGLIGLFLLIGWIMAAFWKIRLELLRNFEWGRFRMALLIAILARNWTEAGFKGLSLSYLIFFIITIDYPQRRTAAIASRDPNRPEEERELAYSQDKLDGVG